MFKISTSKALLFTLEFLEDEDYIDAHDCDYLIRALEKMQRKDLVAKLLLTEFSQSESDLKCFKASNEQGSYLIKINGLDIGLKFQPYNFQTKLAQLGIVFKLN